MRKDGPKQPTADPDPLPRLWESALRRAVQRLPRLRGRVMSNLPPGAAGDPAAPWNQPEPPECADCGNLISEAIDHAEDCPMGHMEPEDIVEAEEAAHQEMKFEQRRLEERGR